jgi:hypothetical protein
MRGVDGGVEVAGVLSTGSATCREDDRDDELEQALRLPVREAAEIAVVGAPRVRRHCVLALLRSRPGMPAQGSSRAPHHSRFPGRFGQRLPPSDDSRRSNAYGPTNSALIWSPTTHTSRYFLSSHATPKST